MGYLDKNGLTYLWEKIKEALSGKQNVLGYTPADAADVSVLTEAITVTPGFQSDQAVNILNDAAPGWTESTYINYNNGTSTSVASYIGTVNYVEISAGARLFARYTNNISSYPTIAFYDSGKRFISGEFPESVSLDDRSEYNGMYGYFYTVPSNAVYFRTSYNKNFKDNIQFYVITSVSVGGKVEIPDLVIPKSPIDGKQVVCFGDSLFGMYRGEGSVTDFIAKETGATVYNCGFGGCRMSVHPTVGYAAFSMWALAKAVAEQDWTFQDAQASSGSSYFPAQLAALKAIDFSNVDIAVIHYGTNDFGGGNEIPIDDASDPDNYNTLCGALRYSLDKLLGAYPKLKIFVSLPVFRFWTVDGVKKYSDSYTNMFGHKLPEFVEALRGVAKEYKLPVIDGYYGLAINANNAATFLEDGTHHNLAGRERFGRFIGDCLVAGTPAYGIIGEEDFSVVDGGQSGLEIYSTEETRIGTWIDEKPLYRKVLNLTSPGNQDSATPLYSISGIRVTNLYGILTDKNGGMCPINAYHGGANYIAVWYSIGLNAFYCQVGHTVSSDYFANKPMTIVIEYTKTTDQATVQLDANLLQSLANMSTSAAMPVTTGAEIGYLEMASNA